MNISSGQPPAHHAATIVMVSGLPRDAERDRSRKRLRLTTDEVVWPLLARRAPAFRGDRHHRGVLRAGTLIHPDPGLRVQAWDLVAMPDRIELLGCSATAFRTELQEQLQRSTGVKIY